MTGTGHKLEQLGYRVEEVEHLGHKEQHQGLAEVGQYGHHRKGHARKVAERVAHKHLGRVPATQPDRQTSCQESCAPLPPIHNHAAHPLERSLKQRQRNAIPATKQKNKLTTPPPPPKSPKMHFKRYQQHRQTNTILCMCIDIKLKTHTED